MFFNISRYFVETFKNALRMLWGPPSGGLGDSLECFGDALGSLADAPRASTPRPPRQGLPVQRPPLQRIHSKASTPKASTPSALPEASPPEDPHENNLIEIPGAREQKFMKIQDFRANPRFSRKSQIFAKIRDFRENPRFLNFCSQGRRHIPCKIFRFN